MIAASNSKKPSHSRAPRELRIVVTAIEADALDQRDQLAHAIIPGLRELLLERDLTVLELDPVRGFDRGRITGRDVRDALDLLRRSRPIFVGLLGHTPHAPVPARELQDPDLLNGYPWIDAIAGKGLSLEEIIVIEGILGNPLMAERAIFLHVPDATRGSLGGRTARSSGASLLPRVREAGFPVIEIAQRSDWLESARQAVDAVVGRIFPHSSPLSALEQVRRSQEAFASSRRQSYVEVGSYRQVLDAHVQRESPPLIVSGESGSGKSALLANWSASYRERNPEAFVIEHYVGANAAGADHIGILRRIMAEIREHFGLSEPLPTPPDEIVSAFPVWLANLQRERLVLVIDGINLVVTGGDSLRWLPTHFPPNVRCIVSSADGPARTELCRRGWGELRMRPLTLSERRDVVREYLGDRRRMLSGKDLRRVSQDAPSANPLFLRIRLEELRAQGPRGSDERIESLLNARDLDDLFEKLLERLEGEHGAALISSVMSLLWCSRRGLTEHDLNELTHTEGTALGDLLGALHFHLISRDGVLTFFHDRLRKAVEDRYTPEHPARNQPRYRVRIAKYFSQQPVTRRSVTEEAWQYRRLGKSSSLRELLSNLDAFIELAAEDNEYELLGYWLWLGTTAQMSAAYEQALDEFQKTEERPPSAAMLDRVGTFLYHAGEYECAEAILERAVRQAALDYVAGDQRTLEIRRHHTKLLLELGRYEEVAENCRQIIEENREIVGEAHPVIISSMIALADALHYTGDLSGSESTVRQALTLCERTHGAEHRVTTEAMHNLAVVLIDRGERMIGESLLRRALTIDEKLYGPDHPTIAFSLTGIASVLADTGRIDEGEELHRRALDIRVRMLGPDHVHTGQSYNGLGLLLNQRGNLDEAESLLSKAHDVWVTHLGDSHPSVAVSLSNLASIARSRGDLDRARGFLERAYECSRTALGAEHATTARIQSQLGRVLMLAGDLDASLEALTLSYQSVRRSLGEEHPSTGALALNLAELFERRQELDLAEEYAHRALAVERTSNGNGWLAARALLQLARVRIAKGDQSSAERVCRQAIDILTANGMSEHPLFQTAEGVLESLRNPVV